MAPVRVQDTWTAYECFQHVGTCDSTRDSITEMVLYGGAKIKIQVRLKQTVELRGRKVSKFKNWKREKVFITSFNVGGAGMCVTCWGRAHLLAITDYASWGYETVHP